MRKFGIWLIQQTPVNEGQYNGLVDTDYTLLKELDPKDNYNPIDEYRLHFNRQGSVKLGLLVEPELDINENIDLSTFIEMH